MLPTHWQPDTNIVFLGMIERHRNVRLATATQPFYYRLRLTAQVTFISVLKSVPVTRTVLPGCLCQTSPSSCAQAVKWAPGSEACCQSITVDHRFIIVVNSPDEGKTNKRWKTAPISGGFSSQYLLIARVVIAVNKFLVSNRCTQRAAGTWKKI